MNFELNKKNASGFFVLPHRTLTTVFTYAQVVYKVNIKVVENTAQKLCFEFLQPNNLGEFTIDTNKYYNCYESPLHYQICAGQLLILGVVLDLIASTNASDIDIIKSEHLASLFAPIQFQIREFVDNAIEWEKQKQKTASIQKVAAYLNAYQVKPDNTFKRNTSLNKVVCIKKNKRTQPNVSKSWRYDTV